MTCAWHGTLSDAARDSVGARWVTEAVLPGFRNAYGHRPSDEEVSAWTLQLPTALSALKERLDGGCHVVVEYRLPFNGQRADLVLLGRSHGQDAAHVVEFKRWESSQAHPRLDLTVRAGGVDRPHPSYQAATYAGKLRHFHSAAHRWEVTASALVLDREKSHHEALRQGKYAELWQAAPVFLPGETPEFAAFVGKRLPESAGPGQALEFLQGTYSQSIKLFEGLSAHREHILRHAMGTLAVSGWGFSDEQLRVFEEIRAAAVAGAPGVHLVQGRPGSGKSLLALHLLLDLVGRRRSVVLAVRSNRLIAGLRAILDKAFLGGGGAIKFFSTRYGQGVEDRDDPIDDVVVCDEGQRLSLRSDNLFRRAPVTVVIYDEGQILNLEERGTEVELRRMAQHAALPIREYALPTPHRCRGGAAYAGWVEAVLSNPGALAAPRPWEIEYALALAPHAPGLHAHVALHRDRGHRVALVAAFTRSSGRPGPAAKEGLGKIRLPEVEPSVNWLMDEEAEYVPFWVEGRSSDLRQCASIYGCQGFETDHAGLVWGNDLVIRKGRWAVGDPANCYDATQQAKRLANRIREDPEGALFLLKNRYRAFLTRGIFGTTIHCEDDETREFMARHLPAPR